MTDTYDIQHTRDQIVEAALPHIPFDGWTMTALNRAAADLGLNEDAAALAFPVSATDAIEHHSGLADRKMVEASGDLSDLPIRVKVATVIRTRLEQNMPHREAIRRACATLAMPAHAPMAARC
ncbi:MAG TPA: COQ9 family protein, partial [Rhodospirillaceae bacterium]|nr:COQ9 family protein [Rhodospirillaceae bacterium]